MVGGTFRLGCLDCEAPSASLTMELGPASVRSLSLSVNAGSARVRLPERGGLQGTVSTNAGSVRLCVGLETAIRIESSGDFLSSNSFAAAGLVRVGSGWETPGFGDATDPIELRASGNLASFDLRIGGACR